MYQPVTWPTQTIRSPKSYINRFRGPLEPYLPPNHVLTDYVALFRTTPSQHLSQIMYQPITCMTTRTIPSPCKFARQRYKSGALDRIPFRSRFNNSDFDMATACMVADPETRNTIDGRSTVPQMFRAARLWEQTRGSGMHTRVSVWPPHVNSLRPPVE